MACGLEWIKLNTGIFGDDKMLIIEGMPEHDTIIVIWFKLLCLAGNQNNSGVIMLSDKIACNDEMLASIFRRPLATVRMALNVFESLGMIEIVNGVYVIPNWSKHQSADKIEKLNEYHRNYMRERRAEQKQKALGMNSDALSSRDVNSKVNSKVNGKVNVKGIDKNRKDTDIQIRVDTDISDNSDISDIQIIKSRKIEEVVGAWNALAEYGVPTISRMSKSSTRYKQLGARLSEYGDDVFTAIENIKVSDFLLGRKSDFMITFDWFVKPNNFVKVLDGNYNSRQVSKGGGRFDAIDNFDLGAV